jgi:hypothetical protein
MSRPGFYPADRLLSSAVGVDIDRRVARRLTARSLERPHLRRPDGSFTNW